MLVTWVELQGPHMGNITRIEFNTDGVITGVWGDFDSRGMMVVIEAVNGRRLLAGDAEYCQVPRANFGDDAEVGGGHDNVESLRRQWAVQEQRLTDVTEEMDSARGAVRLLADCLGIESSDRSHVAKLAKQCQGRVARRSAQFSAMHKELWNMHAAMQRFGFTPPEPEDGVADLPMFCQHLAHHLDAQKHLGFGLVASIHAGNASNAQSELTRDERMSRLKIVQTEAQQQMYDLATIDGFVSKNMSAEGIRRGTMAWAHHTDNLQRIDRDLEEGLSKILENNGNKTAVEKPKPSRKDADAAKIEGRTKRSESPRESGGAK